MNTDYIKSFIVLAKELHFWNAASKLNLPQSTLTRRIQTLEEELSVKLFERTKRNVRLTAAGELLLENWSKIVEDLDLLHAFALKIDQGESGTIAVGFPGSVTYTLLPNILMIISSLYPHMKVKLVEMVYRNTEENLLNYKVDIALSRDIPEAATLNYQKVVDDHFAFVVPGNHPFNDIDDIKAADWSMEKFILPPLNSETDHVKFLLHILDTYHIVPNIFYESDFGNTIISLVAREMGISILPYSYAQNKIENVRFIKTPFESKLHVVWRKNEISKHIDLIVKNLLLHTLGL